MAKTGTKTNDLKSFNKTTQILEKQFSEKIKEENGEYKCKLCKTKFTSKIRAKMHSKKKVCNEKRRNKGQI